MENNSDAVYLHRSYLLRIWEDSGAGGTAGANGLRLLLQDVNSGEKHIFLNFEEMVEYLSNRFYGTASPSKSLEARLTNI